MSHTRKPFSLLAFDRSLVIGVVATAAFYAVVLQPSMRGTLIYHYTAEHGVEYVIVALFLWGLADIGLKVLRLPKEILALREQWVTPQKEREALAGAHKLLEHVRARPYWAQESKIGRRVAQVLEHATHKVSAEEYREHLRYLAGQDEDQTHASYMLARFVIGVSPVLGFLGTVVHFGTALGGISFNELTERLPLVVAEMGTAFNTTTVALAATMTMMFALFVCQRIDDGIVHTVNRMVDRELLKRFDFKDPSIAPFVSALQSANDEALAAIGVTLQSQIELWEKALAGLFDRFDQRQETESRNWQQGLAVLQKRHEEFEAGREDQFKQLLAFVDTRNEANSLHIQSTLDKALAVSVGFEEFAKTLDDLAQGEGALAELQGVLADNLRVLHETHQIDQALHGLTAAIHLLTSRHRQAESRGSAAA